MEKKRVTTLDIAEKLNISIATVDRVLNNRGNVSAKTSELVLQAAKELNYSPNRNARYLSQKVKCTLGISYFLPPWFAQQVDQGIQHAYNELRDFGLKITVSNEAHDSEQQMELIRAMLPEINGLVVAPWEPAGFTNFINELIDQGLPVFTFNNDVPLSRRIMYVGTDYVAAGKVGGRLMSVLARRPGDVGIIIRNEHLTNMEQRIMGFRSFLSGNTDFRVTGPYKVSGILNETTIQVKQILEEYPDMTGLFVASDNLVAVAESVKALGRNGQIAIVGYDLNEQHATLIREEVVSAVICQEPFYQGYYPVKALFDYIVEKQRPTQTEIKTRHDIILKENLADYNRNILY